MNTASAPLPREAEAVLSWWLPRVEALLGDALRAVVLFGSVPLGDFEPGWSDLDVCLQLEGAVPDDLAERVAPLHAELEQRFLVEHQGGWQSTQLLEGPCLSASVAREPGATGRFLQLDTGGCRIADGDAVPGFQRFMLAHHALVLAGEPTHFEPPSRCDLAASQAWLPTLLSRPAFEHSAVMLAGLLQETARSLVFWRGGPFLGKTAALEQEIARGGVRTDAHRVALEVRRAGSARAMDRRVELEAVYEQTVRPACEELQALLASAREAPEQTSG